jgi:putative aldouronate transport system permease protein
MFQIHTHYLSRLYQSALFLPYFISYVIVAAFVFAFLSTNDGLVNRTLINLGLDKIQWYSVAAYWRPILTLVNLWKGVGFWSIVYFAGILAINPEFYEAAKVDGASGWHLTIHITLPLLMPLVIINVLLSIGRIFYADFGLFYQVPRDQGLLYATTNVLDTYVFRALKTTGDIGMASAAGFYQAIVGFLLVLGSNLIVRRIDPDKSLF